MPLAKRRMFGMKIPASVPETPTYNISFHHGANTLKWKYICQRRLALERELGKNALECEQIMELINEAKLRRSVSSFCNCYEMLVKEFIVNIPKDYDNPLSSEYMKVFFRGKCAEFSSEIINRFLGRSEEEHVEVEITDNDICKEITANQVKKWPVKGKLAPSKLSVKYVVLHKIGDANWVPTNHISTIAARLGRFIYIVETKTNFNFGSYVFEQTMKHDQTSSIKMPIAFPSLICAIFQNQHP